MASDTLQTGVLRKRLTLSSALLTPDICFLRCSLRIAA
jgi:hypothetical protein